ncbi:MAG: DsrE family protein [Gallionellaceae bacterium]
MVFFKKIVLLSAVLAMAALTGCATKSDKAGYAENVVYHVNDSAVASAAMNNIKNHMNANPQAKIVLVTHGKGIDFLLEGAMDDKGNPYNVRVQELKAKGVTFDVCNNTLVGRKIDPKTVLPEAVIVPSGVAEVAKLQSQRNFAYVKP